MSDGDVANTSLNMSDDDVASSLLHPCFYVCLVGVSINGMIFAVGIIVNSLTFVVFWKGNFKSSTAFLLLTLSLIDMAILGVVFTADNALLSMYSGSATRERYYLLLRMNHLSYLLQTATIWITVLIAVNRYIIVCLPLRASQWCTLSKVKIQLAVVLVVSVLYNIPGFVRYDVDDYSWNNDTQYHVVDTFPQYYSVLDKTVRIIMMLCLPLCILTLLTIRLIKAIRARRRMQAEMHVLDRQPDNSMTFAVVIVVIVFIICCVPKLVWPALNYMSTPSYLAWCYMTQTTNIIIMFNSAVNFVTYIIINKQFRDVFNEHICRRNTARPVVNVDTIAMSGRVMCESVDGGTQL